MWLENYENQDPAELKESLKVPPLDKFFSSIWDKVIKYSNSDPNSEITDLDFDYTKEYTVNSISSISSWFSNIKPTEKEGELYIWNGFPQRNIQFNIKPDTTYLTYQSNGKEYCVITNNWELVKYESSFLHGNVDKIHKLVLIKDKEKDGSPILDLSKNFLVNKWWSKKELHSMVKYNLLVKWTVVSWWFLKWKNLEIELDWNIYIFNPKDKDLLKWYTKWDNVNIPLQSWFLTPKYLT